MANHSLPSAPATTSTAYVCTEPAQRDQATGTTLCPSDTGTAGGTHGGKGANLFDVLFITLGAGGPPGGPSGVPEGVVILQGVLSWPRDHSLQNRKACLPLVCSSKKENGKKLHLQHIKATIQDIRGIITDFFSVHNCASKKKKKNVKLLGFAQHF